MSSFLKMFRRVALSTAVGTALVMSSIVPAQAVVGGFNSNQGATVKLWAYGYKAADLLCSGSHIGQGWVLTAKHCVNDIGVNTDSTRVVWGNPNINWNTENYSGSNSSVDEIVTNPDSKKDLALVHAPGLAQSWAPSYYLRSGGQAEDLKNASCIAYGYGLWKDDFYANGAYAKHQRGLNVRITTARTNITSSNSSQLRGKGHNGGFLNTGDSGGSLICNGVLSGVTVAYWPGSNTNTFMSISDAERQWITDVTGI
ncbi:trypsin-like serine protease [Corynebacterium sp. CCM 9185]|uniref:Trypsin-like serine protease n=1 Tax=Corynebacterium marambiense TaxID=2765364 RepID=A0ABS0VY60_9CORY|nr:trypsin-like serine protease [Corynebacterium marambiense]MBI9001726.1 trypsin-like serine protease [Corynebacterium marambiense]MCK7662190.1 trypsin-like serine protease [Corynebacterium marambiense]MCX7541460.1 trypsin-like serine protease [Corynebacterium marambiense]